MKTIIKKYKDLPLEEGKSYPTRFQTGETFLLKKIIWNNDKMVKLEGIYEKYPHLGICPIGVDRLISDKEFDCDVEVCSKCSEPI